MPPGWHWRPRSWDYRTRSPSCPRGLFTVLLADAAISLAKGNAFLGDQRIRFFGGVDRGIEFDPVRAETHAIDSYGHDGGRAEREVDAAKQRRLDQLQIALITRRQLREDPE